MFLNVENKTHDFNWKLTNRKGFTNVYKYIYIYIYTCVCIYSLVGKSNTDKRNWIKICVKRVINSLTQQLSVVQGLALSSI